MKLPTTEIPTFKNAVQSPMAHIELGELNFFNEIGKKWKCYELNASIE